MKKLTFILILLTASLSAFSQLGETKEEIRNFLPCNSTKDVIIHDKDNCLIQKIQDELLVYNFNQNTCSSIVLITDKKDSPLYHELLYCYSVKGNYSAGTEIRYSKEVCTYKFYIVK